MTEKQEFQELKSQVAPFVEERMGFAVTHVRPAPALMFPIDDPEEDFGTDDAEDAATDAS